jgi:hypothetical protein
MTSCSVSSNVAICVTQLFCVVVAIAGYVPQQSRTTATIFKVLSPKNTKVLFIVVFKEKGQYFFRKSITIMSITLTPINPWFPGRWRFTLDLFGRVFVDDVGLEPGSIISELGGFPVKEAKFRREMEKLRNSRTVDLTLSKIERERNQLIVQVHTWDRCYDLKKYFCQKIGKKIGVLLQNADRNIGF